MASFLTGVCRLSIICYIILILLIIHHILLIGKKMPTFKAIPPSLPLHIQAPASSPTSYAMLF